MKVSRESTFRFEASFDSPDAQLEIKNVLAFDAPIGLLTLTCAHHVMKVIVGDCTVHCAIPYYHFVIFIIGQIL